MQTQTIYLICSPCNDSYYQGHPTNVAYDTREGAQKHLEDNDLVDEDWPEISYYIQEVTVYSA